MHTDDVDMKENAFEGGVSEEGLNGTEATQPAGEPEVLPAEGETQNEERGLVLLQPIEKEESDEEPEQPVMEGDQVTLVPKENDAQRQSRQIDELGAGTIPTKFDVKLSLTLKACDGVELPSSVPIASGEFDANRVEEMITKAFGSHYFLRRLRAIVGQPLISNENREMFDRKDEAAA